MEMRQLRQFLVLTQERHFERAAAKLGMAQPPLSQAIRRLEATLQIDLLDRSLRRVALTPAGRILAEEAARLVQLFDAAENRVRSTASGKVGSLHVGFTSIALFGVLPQAMRVMRRRWPGIELLLDEVPTLAQAEAIRDGRLDVGFFLYSGVLPGEIAMEPLSLGKTTIAVPRGHPLAKHKTLRLTQLADCPLIMPQRSVNPRTYAAIEAACQAAGFAPRVVQYANQQYTLLNLVAHGLGLAFVTDTGGAMKVSGVVQLPIVDFPNELLGYNVVAWNPRRMSPALEAFLKIVRSNHDGTESLKRRA